MFSLLSYTEETLRNGSLERTEVDPGLVTGVFFAVGGFFIFIIIIAIISLIFWLWMLIDALRKSEEEYKKIGSGDKNLWVILLAISFILGFSLIVSAVYYFVIYRAGKKITETSDKKKS